MPFQPACSTVNSMKKVGKKAHTMMIPYPYNTLANALCPPMVPFHAINRSASGRDFASLIYIRVCVCYVYTNIKHTHKNSLIYIK